MKLAFTVELILALVPQVLFTVSYWRRIPGWVNNPYGRLAQLGSWVHIILLLLYLCFMWVGQLLNVYVAEAMLFAAFAPLVFFGFLQLALLKKAVNSSQINYDKEEVSK